MTALPTLVARVAREADRRLLLAAGAVALAVATFAAALGSGVFGHQATVAIDDFGQLAAVWTAAALCGFAAVRNRGRARLAWALFAISAFTWGLGEVAWSWFEVIQGQPVPFPSLADVGYLTAQPFAIAAALLMASEKANMRARLRMALDGLLIATSLLSISWVLVMDTVYSAGAESAFTAVLGLAYPACDVLIVTVLLLVLARGPRTGTLVVLLASVGLGANAAADSAFAYLNAVGSYQSGSVVDAGWFLGYLLLGLGALVVSRHTASGEKPAAAVSRLRVVLPYVPVLAAGPLVLWRLIAENELDLVLLASLAALGAFAMIRQALTLLDNAALLREVQAGRGELEYLAHHDPLTRLATRARLEGATAAALAGPTPSALLFLDLDDFKGVNDFGGGHRVGDALLALVAERIVSCVRDHDVAARLGGDEFGVLLLGIDGERAEAVAERICQALDEPIEIEGHAIGASASVGIALHDGSEPCTSSELMRRADVGMYAAKRRGKAVAVRWTAALEQDEVSDSGWMSELERTVAAEGFSLHYQPVVDVATGEIAGAEALLRWDHSERGLLAPALFIPDLEESGLIVQVGSWVLREASRQVAAWRRDTGLPLVMHVNVSGRQLQRAGFAASVRAALAGADLPGSALVLEVTETSMLTDPRTAAVPLRAVKRLGVSVALDDFGTGYSSLSYLRELPVDTLKIDRSFVEGLSLDGARTSIAEALLKLGESLGKHTIAEGVETEEQARALQTLGAPQAQGYFYGRPMPAAAFARLVQSPAEPVVEAQGNAIIVACPPPTD